MTCHLFSPLLPPKLFYFELFVPQKSFILFNARRSRRCREIDKTNCRYSLSLLQGERQDSDVVEERNAQVQLEKAKVLSHCCIMVTLRPRPNATQRDPTRPNVTLTERQLSRTRLHHRQGTQTPGHRISRAIFCY